MLNWKCECEPVESIPDIDWWVENFTDKAEIERDIKRLQDDLQDEYCKIDGNALGIEHDIFMYKEVLKIMMKKEIG